MCKLYHVSYGLKQVPRAWYDWINTYIYEMTNLSNASKYLGLEIEHKPHKHFHSSNYIILEYFEKFSNIKLQPFFYSLERMNQTSSKHCTPLGCKFFKVYQNLVTTSYFFVFLT
jgi:hypothetical protein